MLTTVITLLSMGLSCVVVFELIVILKWIIKSLLKKNRLLNFFLLTTLTGIGLVLSQYGDKISSTVIYTIGFFLSLLIGSVWFIYTLVCVIFLLDPNCKLPEKNTKPETLPPTQHRITYFCPDWSIEQYRDAKNFSDLFIDFCMVDDRIRIVRVLNLNIYLAVMSAEGDDDEPPLTMVRYLNKTLTEKLSQNELTYDDLIGQVYNWSSLEELNAIFKSDTHEFIRASEESLNGDPMDRKTKTDKSTQNKK